MDSPRQFSSNWGHSPKTFRDFSCWTCKNGSIWAMDVKLKITNAHMHTIPSKANKTEFECFRIDFCNLTQHAQGFRAFSWVRSNWSRLVSGLLIFRPINLFNFTNKPSQFRIVHTASKLVTISFMENVRTNRYWSGWSTLYENDNAFCDT